MYDRNWAPRAIGDREARLLESEWMLRVAVLGTPFVASLVTISESDLYPQEHRDACRTLLEKLETFQGPGTHQATRQGYTSDIETIIRGWPPGDVDLTTFWANGQVRSRVYEAGLHKLLPGYNTGGQGFMRYRPDYVVAPYRPCSILSALSDEQEAINVAIRRGAHVFEATANNAYSPDTVTQYLIEKLPNYVQLTQEQ